MGNKQCQFIDQNGSRCENDSQIHFGGGGYSCVKHENLFLNQQKEEAKKERIDYITKKYGQEFVKDIIDMYSATPVSKVSSEFKKIVKKHNLVDDKTPFYTGRFGAQLETVFQYDMSRLKDAFESRSLNP